MLRKSLFLFLILNTLGVGLLFSKDVVNILQTDETFSLKTWGSPEFLTKDTAIRFSWLHPEEDLYWGAGFGYIADKKNIGPFLLFPGNTRLKSGNTAQRHPILEFNIPLQTIYAFGLDAPAMDPPSAIVYLSPQKPFSWEKVVNHLKKMGINNAYFTGVVTTQNIWGHYLREDYFSLLEVAKEPHFATFYKDRATVKVQGYFLHDFQSIHSARGPFLQGRGKSHPECLIFETSVFVKDVPTLNTTNQMLEFFNKLGAVQIGFTHNIPMDWKLLRGILFIYTIDSIESN